MNDINTSIRRIVITEDEDLDLDKLLIGDAPVEKCLSRTASPTQPSLAALDETAALTPNVATKTQLALALEEEEEEEEEDEDDEGVGGWYCPAAAKPGDFLNSGIPKVASKSILKTTSSYGNFDMIDTRVPSASSFGNMDNSSTSQGSMSGRFSRSQSSKSSRLVARDQACWLPSGVASKIPKKASFLFMDMSNNSSSSRSIQSSALGLDLDDSSPHYASPNTSVSGGVNFLVNRVPPSTSNLAADGDQASGNSSVSSAKIRRNNVSFASVDVRKYDRTVGDNPSCRSGPPLSLDWGYSKEKQKCIDDYETERSSNRAKNLSKIHVNKYKRKNLLSFQWGHTEEELAEARVETKKLQRQRSITQLLAPVQKAEEAIIGIKTLMTKKKKKKKVTDNGHNWADVSFSVRGPRH